MKTIIKMLPSAILIVLVLCAVSAGKPYWNKYCLSQKIHSAAIYGTKNSVEDTRIFLFKKIKNDGYNLAEDDFYIEKGENSNVTVGVTYNDEISIFGMNLKNLTFTIEESVSEIKSI